MARRPPGEEKPFRPLDLSVLSAVVQHSSVPLESAPADARVLNMPSSQRLEPRRETIPERAAVAVVQRLDQEKRVLYTRDERQALDRLVHNLAVRLQTQLKASHVLRAMTALLLHAEGQIDQRAGERGSLIRPPNGDAAALQRFEREIADLLLHAIRDAGVPR